MGEVERTYLATETTIDSVEEKLQVIVQWDGKEFPKGCSDIFAKCLQDVQKQRNKFLAAVEKARNLKIWNGKEVEECKVILAGGPTFGRLVSSYITMYGPIMGFQSVLFIQGPVASYRRVFEAAELEAGGADWRSHFDASDLMRVWNNLGVQETLKQKGVITEGQTLVQLKALGHPTGFVVKPIFQGENAQGKEMDFWKAMWSAPLITTTPAGAIQEDDFGTAQAAFNEKLNEAASKGTAVQATQVQPTQAQVEGTNAPAATAATSATAAATPATETAQEDDESTSIFSCRKRARTESGASGQWHCSVM